MCSLRRVLTLGSLLQSPQLPFLDEAGKKYCAVIHLALYSFPRTETSPLSMLTRFVGILQAQKSQLFANCSINTRKPKGCCCVVGFLFFLWFCHPLFILFSCASETAQTPIYVWDRSICGDSEVHQPATGIDFHKAACVWGTFCVVYDQESEGSIHLFLLLGWEMNCQLLSTCADMTLHMLEACSACFMLGSPLWNCQFWKRGVCWQGGEEGRRSVLDPFLSFCAPAKWREGGQCLSPLFPQQSFWTRWSDQSRTPARHHSLITLQAARPDAAVFCIRLRWFTCITPQLQLIWYYSQLTGSCHDRVSLIQKTLM